MILLIAADSTSAFPARCFIFISIIILCVWYTEDLHPETYYKSQIHIQTLYATFH